MKTMLNIISWVYLLVFVLVGCMMYDKGQPLDVVSLSLSVVMFGTIRIVYHALNHLSPEDKNLKTTASLIEVMTIDLLIIAMGIMQFVEAHVYGDSMVFNILLIILFLLMSGMYLNRIIRNFRYLTTC